MLTDEGELLAFKETIFCEHKGKWEVAMQEEIKSLHTNDSRDLVDLPESYAQRFYPSLQYVMPSNGGLSL